MWSWWRKGGYINDFFRYDCTLEQIVYHVMRCGLVHGTGENSKIVWNSLVPLALDKDGNLNLSPSFIWGLALAVITCDKSLADLDSLPAPDVLALDIIENLQSALDGFQELMQQLNTTPE